MTKMIGNTEQDERGLLPYPVIIAVIKGDPEAMNIVIQHYDSEIAYLSMRTLRDERGNTLLWHRSGVYATVCVRTLYGQSFHSKFKIVASSVPLSAAYLLELFCSLIKKAAQ